MGIVTRRTLFYGISGALVVSSVTAIAVFGLRLGIDFTGGSILELEFPAGRPAVEELAERIEPLGLGDVRVQPAGERGAFLRLRHIDEPTHQELLQALGRDAVERRFDTIGPTIGRELRTRSLIAIGLVIILIVCYVAWAFRKVSAPVALGRTANAGLASWKYGVVTVVALVHDVLIPSGFFAIAGRVAGYEVDTLFITAILTILGFSVHDTIVVFDRIRENLKKKPGTIDFATIVGESIRQTFTRSVNTSLTVVLALVAVLLAGGESTRAFSFTLIVGIIAGTYSSIFIASPLLVTWQRWSEGGR